MTDPKLEKMAREFLCGSHGWVSLTPLTALLARVAKQADDGSGDYIMMMREKLRERFGSEVDTAFFDDVIHNALVLAVRERDAEWKRVVQEVRELLDPKQPVDAWGAVDEILRRMLDDQRSMTTSTASSVEEEGEAECDSA